jgi:enterochelin esterase-like enzyme
VHLQFFQTLMALGLAATALRGGIQDLSFRSDLNRRSVAIKVYTPPGYEKSGERYPVVYNLHGGNGSPERQWERTGATVRDAMEKGRVRPMIYVYADGLGNTLFLDYADGSLQVESMIVKELIPFIDARFRTIPSHEGRAIDGFSMGGFGALLIAFRYPQLFSSVVSYGGAMLSPEMIRIGGEDGQFPTAGYVENNSPWWLLERNKDRIKEHLRIRMVCGDQDTKWYPGNVKLKERAAALGLKVEWVAVEGVAHDTKGLYERVGWESLKFLESGFDPKLEREEGVARDLFYRSELNRRDVLVKVYTPPGYESSGLRYPVVYNLHGAGGGSAERQWSRVKPTLKDAIEKRKVRPLIYVFVDGLGDTFFLDYGDGSVFAESTLVRELIPLIDRSYRTIASREGRSIEGFSMGGAGALRIAMKHPDLFRAAVSYGAALIKSDTLRPGDPRAARTAVFERENPWKLAREKAEVLRTRLAIRMICGELDGAERAEGGLYALNVEFQDMLKKLGVAVDWKSVPGVAHDTKGLYERAGLESLRFLDERFPR